MAVTPKHTEPGKHYDPSKELSNDQRHRFTEIANKAAERRAEKEAAAKRQHQLEEHPHPEPVPQGHPKPQPNWLRTVIWSLVLGLLWIWILFMTS